MVCALVSGCSHRGAGEAAVDRVAVCGVVVSEAGTPVRKALIELHELAKDTPDDVVANRYELSGTDQNGRFQLRAVTPDRQYFLAIAGTRACDGLTVSEREAKRLPVTFRRRMDDQECRDSINVLLDSGCNLTLR